MKKGCRKQESKGKQDSTYGVVGLAVGSTVGNRVGERVGLNVGDKVGLTVLL